jgi:formylmethanofuran dehydrogenase subunit E
MSKTGAKRHTHKYHNVNGVWMCALSNCTHFMPKNVAANIIGKNSICWDCGSEFILDENNMQNEKPVCCSTDVDVTLEFLKQRGI